jgi:hypothetical protein
MAIDNIIIGTTPNDKTGDTLRIGATKINANFDELDTRTATTISGSDQVSGSFVNLDGDTMTGDLTISGSLNITDGISTVDYVSFNTASADIHTVGTLHWNILDDTLDLHANNVTYQIGQEIAPLVRNSTGALITNGTPVMFAGTDGNSGRVKIQPAIADSSIPSSYILGVATEDIANGDDGHVTWFGKVRAIDTTGTPYGETWNDSDILYVSPTTAGYLTNVKPQAPNEQIFIGVVINSNANNGSYFVRPSWRGKITDLSDVDGFPLTTTGQILVWNESASYFDPTVNINDYQKIAGYTVSTLPTGSATGSTVYVTDALSPTYLNALTGSGTVICPAFYNGTDWISH